MEEKRHADFEKIYRNFLAQYGEEGRRLYSMWLNKYGLDDAKPLEPQLKKLKAEWLIPIDESYGKPLRIRGYAIHAGTTRNWNLYLEDELEKAADSLIGKPIYLEHVSVGNAVGKVVDAGWDYEKKAIWFNAEIYDDEVADKIRTGIIKHVSICADYDVLEPFDNIRIPYGLQFRELSLVAVPGDPEANIFLMEHLLQTQISGGEGVKMEKIEEREWDTAFINSLPDEAFAVIEPAYKSGETSDKRCRHLPHHGPSVRDPDEDSSVDLPHLRNALARCMQIKPFTDSISAEELRRIAKMHLEKHAEALEIGVRGGESHAPSITGGGEAMKPEPQPQVGAVKSAGEVEREVRRMAEPKGLVVEDYRAKILENIKRGSLREQWEKPVSLPTAPTARIASFVIRSDVIDGKPGDTVNIPYVKDFDLDVLSSVGGSLTPKTGLYGTVQTTLKEAAATTNISYADVEKLTDELLARLEERFNDGALRAIDKHTLDTLIADTGVPELDKSSASVDFDADWVAEALGVLMQQGKSVNPGDCLLVVNAKMYEALLKDIAGTQPLAYVKPDVIERGVLSEFMGVSILVSNYLPEHDGTTHKKSAYLIHKNALVFAPKRELLLETERDTVARSIKLTGSLTFGVAILDNKSIAEIKTPVA